MTPAECSTRFDAGLIRHELHASQRLTCRRNIDVALTRNGVVIVKARLDGIRSCGCEDGGRGGDGCGLRQRREAVPWVLHDDQRSGE